MLKIFRSKSHLGQPWAITEPAMREIRARADREDRDFSAIAKEWGSRPEGTYEVEIHKGIAVIPVSGVPMRRLSFWGWFEDASAYELLIKDIAAAVKNPDVKAIVLDVDSPGGEVTGVGELADAIRAMAAEKTIIVCCVATITDASGMLERAGVKT